jgi:uncharacterized lipoprotein NlpE involved in copper resistance
MEIIFALLVLVFILTGCGNRISKPNPDSSIWDNAKWGNNKWES